ncbi:hypothetical protein PSACC_00541 [Paramicrosporidium saccamoebae]|uniref:Uncharacterized protein n=1 Tax=Paramicrosporidium saccamoebae TaxID=1246581 RepID=A0A2H9TPK7_9FUNG|nr:hypothetical protein PSACC_00541 [Paramicrosporidium saccamoebae]
MLAITPVMCGKKTDNGYIGYVGGVYAVAEDWWGVAKMYDSLKESCPSCAELLLKQAPSEAIRKEIEDGQVQLYKPGGMTSKLASLVSGKYPEWPGTGTQLLTNIELARSLLESKQWTALRGLILDEILPDPDYPRYNLPRRIVVACGLALMDFKNDCPNCVAPWRTKEVGGKDLTIGKKAKIIEAVLKMRNNKLIISGPHKACEEVGMRKDLEGCVRVLVAGGYSRADELFANIKNDDELTVVAGCFYLETRGPKEAVKYYGNRPPIQNKSILEFVGTMRKTLLPLSEWHSAAKTLAMACPCQETELPIFRRVRRSAMLNQEVKASIKNREKLFWALCAAQYKEPARENYEKLKTDLDPILPGLKASTMEKVKEALKSMEDSLLRTELIDLSHVAKYQDHMNKAVKALQVGDIPSAQGQLDSVTQKVRETGEAGRAEEDPSVQFITLMIAAFRNPQILFHEAISFLRFDDWKFNWYVAQAVDQYTSGANRVLLVDQTVDQDLFNMQYALILFFSGRFQDVLDLNFELPDSLKNYTLLCAMKRQDVCTIAQKPIVPGVSDEPSVLLQTIPPSLCNAIRAAQSAKAVRDPVVPLSPESRQVLTNMSAQSYLQPPLPSEARMKPLSAVMEVRIISPPLTLDPEAKARLEARKTLPYDMVSIPEGVETRGARFLKSMKKLKSFLKKARTKNGKVNLDDETREAATTLIDDLPVVLESKDLSDEQQDGIEKFFAGVRKNSSFKMSLDSKEAVYELIKDQYDAIRNARILHLISATIGQPRNT